MRVKLIDSGQSSAAMERHYQRLIEAGWRAIVSKETKTIKGYRGWDIEETSYEIILGSESESTFLFDLSDVLREELVVYREDGHPVIEIYDDWRE